MLVAGVKLDYDKISAAAGLSKSFKAESIVTSIFTEAVTQANVKFEMVCLDLKIGML